MYTINNIEEFITKTVEILFNDDFFLTYIGEVYNPTIPTIQTKKAIKENDKEQEGTEVEEIIEGTEVEEIIIDGKLYLRDSKNIIYDVITEDYVGMYDFNLASITYDRVVYKSI